VGKGGVDAPTYDDEESDRADLQQQLTTIDDLLKRGVASKALVYVFIRIVIDCFLCLLLFFFIYRLALRALADAVAVGQLALVCLTRLRVATALFACGRFAVMSSIMSVD
jgi:hypothetical protein